MPFYMLDGENPERFGKSVDEPTDQGGLLRQDLERVYRDFGIDSKGNFYTRLKPNQDFF